jgi:translation elongation factor EF-Tu-like GTPase
MQSPIYHGKFDIEISPIQVSTKPIFRNKKAKALHLPAHDVEKQVSLRLQSFLRSPNAVIKSLTLPEDHPEITQKLIAPAGVHTNSRFTIRDGWTASQPDAALSQHESIFM